jgi:hypothetical protein
MTKKLAHWAGAAPMWKKGQSGNPAGRKYGSRQKLGEAFLTKLYNHFLEHGDKVLDEVRQTRPDIYLKVVAATLPRELHFKAETALDGITDEQLEEIHSAVRATITARTGPGSSEGETKASGGSKLN